jgi:hypothetical protein
MGNDKAPTAANPIGNLTSFVCPHTRWHPTYDPTFPNIIIIDGGRSRQGSFNCHMQQRINHNERFIVRDFFLRLRYCQKRQAIASSF